MQQKFNVGLVTFSYGGNGGISSEVPDIREWMTPLVCEISRDPRIDNIRIWNLADTPITMTRNRAVLQARQYNVDVLVMIDSDMKPDVNAGQPGVKPWFQSSFDFLVNHYHKGPCVIGAPYCGPPPVECVYVFRWQNMQSFHPNPDFQLEMYDRHTAVKMAGIQECAALPTGLIMYDMRSFELTEPKTDTDKPWFYYEWKDKYAAEKASTEDVTQTRDLSLVGTQKLGYNPVYCNWDAWAGHWKPKCVGKPQFIDAGAIAEKMKQSFQANVSADTKVVSLSAGTRFLEQLRANTFQDLGMDLPDADEEALTAMVSEFHSKHGRYPEIVEVGSWAGRSAIIMAHAGATVTCVDHWKGNANDDGTRHVGQKQAYETFLKNTESLRNTGRINVFLGSSSDAAKHFSSAGVSFDIAYIDAEHDEQSVKTDIALWKPLARHLIAGHDYYSFPSVKRAVDESLESVSVRGNVWTSSA